MLKRIPLIIVFVLAATLPALAQATKTLTLPKPTPPPPPGNIQLLDGYTHKVLQGVDTSVGEISKPGGMTIHYDNGRLAGFYARKCGEGGCLWYKRQLINGREVWLSLSKEGRIVATFPKEHANFLAQTKSPEDIADFLLIVLTYRASGRPAAQEKSEEHKPKQK